MDNAGLALEVADCYQEMMKGLGVTLFLSSKGVEKSIRQHSDILPSPQPVAATNLPVGCWYTPDLRQSLDILRKSTTVASCMETQCSWFAEIILGHIDGHDSLLSILTAVVAARSLSSIKRMVSTGCLLQGNAFCMPCTQVSSEAVALSPVPAGQGATRV